MTIEEYNGWCRTIFESLKDETRQFAFKIKLKNSDIIQFYPLNNSNRYRKYFYIDYIYVDVHNSNKKETVKYFLPISLIEYITVVLHDKKNESCEYISW